MKTNDESARKVELRTAAAHLFRKVGYARATVRDVAKAVGLQSGSIFYYYETKEEILVDVMREGMRRFMETVMEPLRDATTPVMRLRALLIGHLKALHGGNDELAVILSEWRSLAPNSRRKIVKQRDEIEAMWDRVLRELATEGRVHGDLAILRLALLGAANWSLQWYDERGRLSIDALADQLLELFVPGAEKTA
jgi:AcrR family transcriptional regulator